MTFSPAIEDFVEEARRVRVEDEITRRGIKLRRCGVELVGPCPACGGEDRFAVNTRKNVWRCRVAGTGGDAIALARYVDGTDFLVACETVLGRPCPKEIERPDPEALARRERERAGARMREAAAAEEEAKHYREEERRRAFGIWQAGRPARGSPVEAYLRDIRRIDLSPFGFAAPPSLRFHPAAPFWFGTKGEDLRIIHEGPAMLAAVARPDGRFGAVHITWLDLDAPKGKARIVAPDGKGLSAKKCRGTKRGGHVPLLPGRGAAAGTILAGEGIETTLTVAGRLAEAGEAFAAARFWMLVDLDNMTGKATGQVRHPTLTRTDVRGRVSAQRVPNGEPKLDDDCWSPPAGTDHVIFLGDGDSDRFTTELALQRAVARARHFGTPAAAAWPAAGVDFNDMVMGRVA